MEKMLRVSWMRRSEAADWICVDTVKAEINETLLENTTALKSEGKKGNGREKRGGSLLALPCK